MPTKAATACPRRGCRGLVRDGVCSVCGPLRKQRQVENDQRRGNSRERGYHSGWDKLRAWHLAAHPNCARCEEAGVVRLADLVHHVLPLCDGGELLDPDNLKSLCRACHGVVHADLDRQWAIAW
jgi:5-methylcytosine-specific restriction enzyme A